MKVYKEKFLDAINYIKEVNSCSLKDLDLSEFFDKDRMFEIEHTMVVKDRVEDFSRYLTYDEIITEWGYIGLSNRDFITMFMKEDNK